MKPLIFVWQKKKKFQPLIYYETKYIILSNLFVKYVKK